jgi:hypothetical protein
MSSHHGVPRDRDRDKPQPKVPQRAEARLKSAPLFVSSNMLQVRVSLSPPSLSDDAHHYISVYHVADYCCRS